MGVAPWESLLRAARTCRKRDAHFAATVEVLRTDALERQKGLDVTRVFNPDTGTYAYEDDAEFDRLLEELVATLQRWSDWLEQELV